MKLNQVSAVMNESELELIVKAAVEAQTGLKVANVVFNVGTRSTGYGAMESSEPHFKGATVTFISGQDIKVADLHQ